MRRVLIHLMLALALVGAGCGGQPEQPSAAPATTEVPSTTVPPATLASTTTRAPSRARQLQRALRRKYSKVRSVSEDADGITIKTSYIFNFDNAVAGADICETTKALVADARSSRWLPWMTAGLPGRPCLPDVARRPR
jgi:hypothetical protein